MKCIVDGCDKDKSAIMLCPTHYWHYKYLGKDVGVTPPEPMTRSQSGKIGGSRGKKDGTIKGFGLNPELAIIAGRRGGKAKQKARKAEAKRV
jgi:hypothetical protein